MSTSKNNILENKAIPIELATKIINDIPSEMWCNPNNKFCYASIVDSLLVDLFIDKLLEGLRNIILDDSARLNHILTNMIYGITLDKHIAKIVESTSNIKNIFVIDITKDSLKNMPKFDYIIQNPPYSGETHLDFFRNSLALLKDTGKMVIIEPSTWLINLKNINTASDIKNKINGHISKIILDNYAKDFNVGLYVPCSITYINFATYYNYINFYCCGDYKKVKNIEDCTLIGSYNIFNNILLKIKNSKFDILKNHIYNPKKQKDQQILTNKDNWYTKFKDGQIGMGGPIESGGHTNGGQIKYNQDSLYITTINGEYKKSYISVMYYVNTELNNIDQIPIKGVGSNKEYTDKDDICLYDTKEHLENWKYNVFNLKLLLFISICFTINASNNIKDIMPWIVNKKYTDNEIYTLLNLNNDEINLIEFTTKKYERYSLWYMRYMCGPNSVSDKEVQEFINKLI